MSGDIQNPFPVTPDEAEKITQMPLVFRLMDRKPQLIAHDYDVPYVSGHSPHKGKFVYVDKNLQLWRFGRSLRVDCKRFLYHYELILQALLDAIRLYPTQDGAASRETTKEIERLMMALRMTDPTDNAYLHCHCVAMAGELYGVRQSHGDVGVRSYQQFMVTQIRREKLTDLPPELDLIPYIANNETSLVERAMN